MLVEAESVNNGFQIVVEAKNVHEEVLRLAITTENVQ